MMSAGEPDDEPLAIAGGIADQMGAIMLAYGVLAALLAREKTGRGQEVDASHLGSMSWLQGLGLSARLMLGRALPRTPRKYTNNPLWNHYKCADGEWIALAMLQSDRYWPKICEVLGVAEAATDARFATILDRMMNAGDCIAPSMPPRDPTARRVARGPPQGRRLHRLGGELGRPAPRRRAGASEPGGHDVRAPGVRRRRSSASPSA
jgi:hypothetical protein